MQDSEQAAKSVLVPGAGSARLAYEIALLGFLTQGLSDSPTDTLLTIEIANDTSHLLPMTWQWFRTIDARKAPRVIYPFIHKSQNVKQESDATRQVYIPDVVPTRLPNLSFEISDFVHTYSQEKHKAAWDVIATCFFIDTATNILDYLRTIRHCLKSDGAWLNYGNTH